MPTWLRRLPRFSRRRTWTPGSLVHGRRSAGHFLPRPTGRGESPVLRSAVAVTSGEGVHEAVADPDAVDPAGPDGVTGAHPGVDGGSTSAAKPMNARQVPALAYSWARPSKAARGRRVKRHCDAPLTTPLLRPAPATAARRCPRPPACRPTRSRCGPALRGRRRHRPGLPSARHAVW